jgi:hypothetical protein
MGGRNRTIGLMFAARRTSPQTGYEGSNASHCSENPSGQIVLFATVAHPTAKPGSGRAVCKTSTEENLLFFLRTLFIVQYRIAYDPEQRLDRKFLPALPRLKRVCRLCGHGKEQVDKRRV